MFGLCAQHEDNAEAVQAVLAELRIRKAILVGIPWWLCGAGFAELYPDL
jgi:hypothetical protein